MQDMMHDTTMHHSLASQFQLIYINNIIIGTCMPTAWTSMICMSVHGLLKTCVCENFPERNKNAYFYVLH